MSAPASPTTAALIDADGRAGVGDVPLWRDRLLIAAVYAAAWGAMLVNRGLYWDDWTLRGLPASELIRGSWELGLPWIGYFYAVLYATPLPGLVGHALVFIAYLGSSLLFHAVVRRVPGVGRMDALVAGLTFAVLPVNYARIALIDLTYALSLLAFLAASWLLVRYADEGALWRRVAALALFVCSFSTASLLVLYVVPVVAAALVLRRRSEMSILAMAVRHADIVLLPVVYWVLKTLFLRPSGVYEGYNALTARGLAAVPGLLPDVPNEVVVEPLYRAVVVGGLPGVAVGVLVAVVLILRDRAETTGADVRTAAIPGPVLALLGVGIVALGVFPYLAVSRIPMLFDWSSRHQLLVPIGVALIAAAVARGVPLAGGLGRAVGIVLVGGLLGISVVADARTLKAYQQDWFKQVALIDFARSSPAIAGARHIMVFDNAPALNALKRRYRFYEYNALLHEALGDTKRLASLEGNEPSPEEIGDFIARPQYHMTEYEPVPVDLMWQIEAPEGAPGVLEVIRLVGLEASGSPSFAEEVGRLIEVKAGYWVRWSADRGDDLVDHVVEVVLEAEP